MLTRLKDCFLWIIFGEISIFRYLCAKIRGSVTAQYWRFLQENHYRWTKLTGLEVDFESDITSSTVTYPLPSQKGGQKGGRINIDTENISADNQYNTYNSGGQKEVVRNSGQKQWSETRRGNEIQDCWGDAEKTWNFASGACRYNRYIPVSHSKTYRTPQRCGNHYPSRQRPKRTMESVEIIWRW